MGFATLVQLVLALMSSTNIRSPNLSNDYFREVVPDVVYTVIDKNDPSNLYVISANKYERSEKKQTTNSHKFNKNNQLSNILHNIVLDIIDEFEKRGVNIHEFNKWFPELIKNLYLKYGLDTIKIENPFPAFKPREVVNSGSSSSFSVVVYNYHIPEEYQPRNGLPMIENIFRYGTYRGWKMAQTRERPIEVTYYDLELDIPVAIHNYYKGDLEASVEAFIAVWPDLFSYYQACYEDEPEWFFPTAEKITKYILYLWQQLNSKENIKN